MVDWIADGHKDKSCQHNSDVEHADDWVPTYFVSSNIAHAIAQSWTNCMPPARWWFPTLHGMQNTWTVEWSSHNVWQWKPNGIHYLQTVNASRFRLPVAFRNNFPMFSIIDHANVFGWMSGECAYSGGHCDNICEWWSCNTYIIRSWVVKTIRWMGKFVDITTNIDVSTRDQLYPILSNSLFENAILNV